MTEATIVGVGMHKFGRFPYETIEEIGQDAIIKALHDAGNIDFKKIQIAFCGSMHGGTAIGNRILSRVGLTGIPCVNVENACSSGGAVIKLAVQAILSGEYDTVLVFGIEKPGRGFLPLNSYPMWEHLSGLGMPPVQLALRATRYMYEYGATIEDFAKVVVKSRNNAALNPNAMYHKRLTIDEVIKDRPVSYPLTISMLAPPCEGAAAAIITSKNIARQFNAQPINIAAAVTGVAQYGTVFCGMSAGFETDSTKIKNPEVTTVLSALAYEKAGISPKDLDLIELNDNTAASELMFLEEMGICGPGEAIKLVADNNTNIDGDIPVNPSGGLLSLGEPVGATGVAQAAEIVWQLRGQAGQRQVKDAKIGLCETAGAGGNCAVVILKR
ncbi:MAG: thiolase family protein [Dehalococcoidales bacterium]|nr:thiolase family protein [Dehalococcoidales bacterium]